MCSQSTSYRQQKQTQCEKTVHHQSRQEVSTSRHSPPPPPPPIHSDITSVKCLPRLMLYHTQSLEPTSSRRGKASVRIPPPPPPHIHAANRQRGGGRVCKTEWKHRYRTGLTVGGGGGGRQNENIGTHHD